MTILLDDPEASTHAAAASVTIDGVSVAYVPGVEVVRSASLEIPVGQTMALLGPSGSGKTSLLRAIAGLERPTAGTISVGGRVLSGPKTWVKPERRAVGMVFQDGALFPHLTVAENIAFGLRRMRRRDVRERVDGLLELIDLAGYGDRLPNTLSGGQRQRVALARSLAPRPSVLLLDEPFSALDASLRVQVRAEVGQILRDIGVTAIFVTHDQDEAFVLGDQVAVMRDGVIEQVGSPDALYRTPTSPWVAGFVGEANLISGDVSGPDRSIVETPLGPLRVLHAVETPSAVVLVRPEQLDLAPGDDATITDVEYYGHDIRYEVRLDGGAVVAARSSSSDVRQRGDRVAVRPIGGPCEVWPA